MNSRIAIVTALAYFLVDPALAEIDCEYRISNISKIELAELRKYSDCGPIENLEDVLFNLTKDHSFEQLSVILEDKRNCRIEDLETIAAKNFSDDIQIAWLGSCMAPSDRETIVKLSREYGAKDGVKATANLLAQLNTSSFGGYEKINHIERVLPHILATQIEQENESPVWSDTVVDLISRDDLAKGTLEYVVTKAAQGSPERIKLVMKILMKAFKKHPLLLKTMALAAAVSGPPSDPLVMKRLEAIGIMNVNEVLKSISEKEKQVRKKQVDRLLGFKDPSFESSVPSGGPPSPSGGPPPPSGGPPPPSSRPPSPSSRPPSPPGTSGGLLAGMAGIKLKTIEPKGDKAGAGATTDSSNSLADQIAKAMEGRRGAYANSESEDESFEW